MKSITIVLLLLSSISFSQEYDFIKYAHYKNLAYHQDSVRNYQSAVGYYDSMLVAVDFHPYDYYDAFVVAWKQKNYSKTNDFLIRGTLKGLDIKDWYGEELKSYLSTEDGQKYLLIKDSLLVKHFSLIDTASYNILTELIKRDQRLRDGSKEVNYNDSLNFEALIKLSEERGFPTFPKVGYGCSKAWLLLWHHRNKAYPNSSQWQRIIPLINKEIQAGFLDPDFFEMFESHNKK